MHTLKQRRAGILLHPTSLPGPLGSGDLGPNAYWFVDFLQNSGISVWQTLPLGVPHGDLSPYQCQSVHAGNPRLISLELLVERGWLQNTEIHLGQTEDTTEACRSGLLAEAFTRFKLHADSTAQSEYDDFLSQNAFWLKDYALFRALKDQHQYKPWWEWESKYRDREYSALVSAKQRFAPEIAQYSFEQFLFFQQWLALKQYANEHQVLMFGDLPIFVAADSVDVWAGRENFQMNEQGRPSVVAGVPPDYFSATGQLWGNPHYHWEHMQSNGFQWWQERLCTQGVLFDVVRIDHFRGFEAYWEVQADAENAMDGRWVKAPGEALFKTLMEKNTIPLVAEDLGVITDEVTALREQFGIPGMKILQFAYEGGGAENPYLPHQHESNCVVYTGTHDNDTTLGWFRSMSPQVQQHVCEYLNANPHDMPWPMIRAAFASVAKLAIVPMQDVLGYGSEHRMNIPGVPTGNWRWRFTWEQVPHGLDKKIRHLLELYGRLSE